MTNFDFTPSASDLAQLMRSRRTVNDFRPQVPTQEIILQAIDVARWAPNHKLTEPWRFHLIGPETAAKIVDLNARITAAEKGPSAAETKRAKWSQIPGWLAVTSLRSADRVRDDENYAAVCCAIQNLTLLLWEQGVGSKWTTGGVTRHPEFQQLLGLNSETDRMVGLLWYGYPAARPEMQRRPVSEITQIYP
ncbi:nitroreductase family protein [Planctomicrobium piriforme]|uniref:Putative NAD(P)H nitroreductase n=1 Tax=Planctomicrobium piriforme TaxID=1576369 RepID=A0A1I3LZ90_9PLAN|nr:nitroreductase [Planctomicrobium piriforme]SFI89756.1 Nitroreductase [Planctomicrobium piriforme]